MRTSLPLRETTVTFMLKSGENEEDPDKKIQSVRERERRKVK